MKISNVKMLYKILACFGLFTLVVAGAVWFATAQMKAIDHVYSDIITRDVEAQRANLNANLQVAHFGRLSWRAISETDPAVMKTTSGEIATNWKQYSDFIDEAKKQAPRFATLFERQRETFADINKDYAAIEKVNMANNKEEAIRMTRALSTKNAAMRKVMAEASAEIDKSINDISQQASRDVDRVIVVTVSAISIAAAIVIALAFAMVQFGIARPLNRLTASLKTMASGNFDVALPGIGRKDEIGQIAEGVGLVKDKAIEKAALEADENLRRQKAEAEAQARAAEERARAAEEQSRVVESLAEGLRSLTRGDLTFRLPDNFPDDYKQIRDDFNSAISGLQETILAISNAAREVAGAASEISSGTTDLSQRTEEQAASLEETSASMEQISATVKQNAESAQQADQFTRGTRDVGDRGGQVVAEAISAMSRIEESSGKISDIISVIDEIARQTNLLALNAAVEAARAGEAGRGFAVVASEVRSLAQRSSQAAKDIKDLITNSSGQVQEGVELVNRAGTSLNEIVESIKKVATIVSQIASASSEQATGIDQINKALSQMDEVTQQNSALVEQNAASAKTLEQQSVVMDERVRFFRLGDGAAAAKPSAVVAMPSHRPAAAEKRAAPPAPRRAAAGRTRGATALAVKDDQDWQEF